MLLIKNKTIEKNSKETQKLSEYMGELEIFHPDLMEKNYYDNGIKNIPQYDSNLEDQIFKDGLIEEMNCPIGGVENFESFLQKYCLTSNQKIIDIYQEKFFKWRRILGDGDSFYRVFMFSILEAYILSNNIKELNFLISEITSNEFIEIYKEKKINYEICFSIFSIILKLVENKDSINAYNIFLKSYLLKDFSFDKLLILYLKHVILININKLKDLLKEKEININIDELNTDLIESSNIEVSFFIICLIPYLFNVNMIIFKLNGELLEPNQSQLILSDPENKEIPVIIFGYFFSSYYKLYSLDFEVKYNYKLELIENNNKQLTYIFKEFKNCQNCKKDTEHILFLEKKFIICKNCLEDHLSDVCNFRADAFKEDGFIGLEYYTRPIHLCDNYYIDDLEIIELLESLNLVNILCQKYTNSIPCSKCKESKEIGELIKLNCGCMFCKNCIQKYVTKKTNGIKYMNYLERKETEEAKCICGKLFDFKEALKHVKYNNEDIKNSLIRLKNYINTLCLVCNIDLRIQEGEDKFKDIKNLKYKKIKLKKNMVNNRDNNLEENDHLICEKCYIKNFRDTKIIYDENEEEEENDENDRNAKVVDLDKETIFCNVCGKQHFLDPKVVDEGGCCTDCSIF